jgi:hypothetical protein
LSIFEAVDSLYYEFYIFNFLLLSRGSQELGLLGTLWEFKDFKLEKRARENMSLMAGEYVIDGLPNT